MKAQVVLFGACVNQNKKVTVEMTVASCRGTMLFCFAISQLFGIAALYASAHPAGEPTHDPNANVPLPPVASLLRNGRQADPVDLGEFRRGTENESKPGTMRNKLSPLVTVALAVLFCSCATTTIEKTWKLPGWSGGPVKKVAVLAVSDHWLVRPGLENRFAQDIAKQGQPVITTLELLRLEEIKANKDAAVALLREKGVDSVLIVRLVDKTTYDSEVRVTPNAFVPVATGYSSYGWGGYYDVAFVDMSVPESNTRDVLILDSSLFDLNTGQRLWSMVTKSRLTYNTDKLVVADDLADKVSAALRKDGMIR